MMKKRLGSCALCGFNNNECNVVVSPTPNLSINDNDPRRPTKFSMQVANNRILHTDRRTYRQYPAAEASLANQSESLRRAAFHHHEDVKAVASLTAVRVRWL